MKKIGIDLGMKQSVICELNDDGKIEATATLPTTRAALTRWFGQREKVEICLEAGGSSPWVDRLLREFGHDVVVVNPRRVKLIAESTLKTDKIDAEILARLLRGDRTLLRPVQHRSEETQRLRAQLRVRDVLINSRTACINSIRGLLRSFGYKLPKGTTEKFAERFDEAVLPEALRGLVAPLAETVRSLSVQIKTFDAWVVQEAEAYPEVKHFKQIDGIGALTALAFVLCIEDPTRFSDSRRVGAYLGMRPRLRQSCGDPKMGRINKEGDTSMRRLLVQCAHSVLRSRSSSELREFGLRLMEKKGRKVAVVAVARKLGVLMHRIWVTGEAYDPHYHQHRRERDSQVETVVVAS
jgi:transposase